MIKKGADINALDNDDRTPLDIAKELNRQNVIDLLSTGHKKGNWISIFQKPPLTREERSYFNIIFFILAHLICEGITFFALLPCINIY